MTVYSTYNNCEGCDSWNILFYPNICVSHFEGLLNTEIVINCHLWTVAMVYVIIIVKHVLLKSFLKVVTIYCLFNLFMKLVVSTLDVGAIKKYVLQCVESNDC